MIRFIFGALLLVWAAFPPQASQVDRAAAHSFEQWKAIELVRTEPAEKPLLKLAQRTTPCADSCNGMAFGGGNSSGGGGGAVVFGATTYTGNQTGLPTGANTVVTSPSGSPTCAVLVFFEYPGNSLPSGVTYGGTAMSLAVQQNTPATMAIGQMWVLASPPTGAQNVVVTTTEANAAIAGYLYTVTNSNTSQCLRTSSATASLVSSGTTISQSVTSAANDLVIDLVGSYQTETWTPGGSQTSRGTNTASAANTSTSSESASGSSSTMSWTFTSAPVTQLAASIQHQ